MFYDFWIEFYEDKLLDQINKIGFKGASLVNTPQENTKKELIKGKVISPQRLNDLKDEKEGFIILNSSDKKIQQKAVKSCRIDAIYGTVDFSVLNEMRNKKIALIVKFRDFIYADDPAKLLAITKKNVFLARKHKVPLIIASGAKNYWEIKSPSELIALGIILGLNKKEAKETLYKLQEKIIEREWLKKQGKYITPSIKIV